VDYSVWERDPYLAFRVSLSPADYSIESKFAEKTTALGSITKIDRGWKLTANFDNLARKSPNEFTTHPRSWMTRT